MRGQETLNCPWFYCLSSELFSLTNCTNGFSFSSQNCPQVQMYCSLTCLEDPSLLIMRALFTCGLLFLAPKIHSGEGHKEAQLGTCYFTGQQQQQLFHFCASVLASHLQNCTFLFPFSLFFFFFLPSVATNTGSFQQFISDFELWCHLLTDCV